MLKRLLYAIALMLSAVLPAAAQYVTLTGVIQASNGLPASNYSISFTPTQWFFVAGSGVTINTTTQCATDVNGSVVGTGNPLAAATLTNSGSGTLPAGNYYVEIGLSDASGNSTQVSPEAIKQLTVAGTLNVFLPSSDVSSTGVAMTVYIGTTSGGETYQGQSTTGIYAQSTPLTAGAAVPTVNTTVCKQTANDAGWPTGTGYQVSLADTSGNTVPGYPMTWQLLGAGTTINLSNGLPYYNGVVMYPSPILASPLNHNAQSISGGLSLGAYTLTAGTVTVNGASWTVAAGVPPTTCGTTGSLYSNTTGTIGTLFYVCSAGTWIDIK